MSRAWAQTWAYFVAKNGYAGMEHPHAPRVFERGRGISLIEAANTHVDHAAAGRGERVHEHSRTGSGLAEIHREENAAAARCSQSSLRGRQASLHVS